MKQPKLIIKQYKGTGYESWGLFKADQSRPIISGITRKHAVHLKKICSHLAAIPDKIDPITDWYDHDEIVNTR